MSDIKKTIILCILDGWGMVEGKKYSAITEENTPNFYKLWNQYPHSTLEASGGYVGLPDGQMGNSEVGHLNIGAGRLIMQELPRINKAIATDELRNNEVIKSMISTLKGNGHPAHLMGLMSDGGVHSHQKHITALAKIFAEEEVDVWVHAFLDGRDTPPRSAVGYMEQFINDTKMYPKIRLGSVCGRFYAMDRDNRWERVKEAYDMLVNGSKIKSCDDLVEYVKKSYGEDITDEFVKPVAINDFKGLGDGDAFLFCNFRADRAREITAALGDRDFKGFPRSRVVKFSAMAEMTEYSAEHAKYLATVFPTENISNTLGEVISNAGMEQLRIAETEKYAHVTFFLNGGREEQFKGEERILIPSPKVATYDLDPDMSAEIVKNNVLEGIKSGKFDLIVVNFANPDMVGHTGNFEAAKKATAFVDKCLDEIANAVVGRENDLLFVTADHGNAEKMVDPSNGQPFTAHTTSKVPFLMIGKNVQSISLKDGILANIAPTILEVLNIEKPKEMTEDSLIWRG